MPTITLTFPDTATVTRVVNAFCGLYGYTGDPADTTARNTFARQQLVTYIKQAVVSWETQQQQAQLTAPTDPSVTAS